MVRNYCETCAWKEGTSKMCDNCFYSKLAEERGVPPTGYEEKKKQTNGDRLRAMTDEEIVKLLAENFCDTVCGKDVCDGQCFENILKWLKQEVEDSG